VIDREKFQTMIQMYYAMSGLDEDGSPTHAKLHDLHLEWLAEN
jgi:aldehyde:ferredoxin oxidoreductase